MNRKHKSAKQLKKKRVIVEITKATHRVTTHAQKKKNKEEPELLRVMPSTSLSQQQKLINSS